MKSKYLLLLGAALCSLFTTVNPLHAQGTAFGYQGRLTSGTNPADGSYDLTFAVFNVLSGVGQVGPTLTNTPTAVSNGMFTVTLDFGPGVFDGADLWLEIGVCTNGGGAYTMLSPRQALTPTPYAIHAGNAGTLGGQAATAYVTRAGDTMTGTLQINRSGSGVGLFVGDRTPFGQALFETDLTAPATHAFFAENGNRVFSVEAGGVGFFKGNLSLGGNANITGSASVFADASIGNNLSVDGNFYMGSTIFGSSGEVRIYGPRVFPDFATERFKITAGGSVTIKAGAGIGVSASGGDKGVYGITTNAGPTHAGVFGENSAIGGTAVVGNALNINSAGVAGVADGAGSTGVYGRGNLWAGYFDGAVRVNCLTIAGGCDVAEPFQMSTREIPKGAVVVIDDENAGQLKLSDRAYDPRVAGIVSGANGINSGISLHQEGVLEGGQNVALTGRVYVQADASQGAIKPGDLLTTSNTPGHAMKVTDHTKSQGAILGKAMSSLKEGKGMVLVLVTLQ